MGTSPNNSSRRDTAFYSLFFIFYYLRTTNGRPYIDLFVYTDEQCSPLQRVVDRGSPLRTLVSNGGSRSRPLQIAFPFWGRWHGYAVTDEANTGLVFELFVMAAGE